MSKYIALMSGALKEAKPISISTGAANANEIVETGVDGKLHISVMPLGVSRDAAAFIAAYDMPAGSFVTISSLYPGYIQSASYDDPDSPAHGFLLEDVAVDELATVYFSGVNNKLSGLIPGQEYYLAYGGDVRLLLPTITDPLIQVVGIALSPTEILFQKNPSFFYRGNLP